ncbi:hypothetical protein RB200_29185 [Streptomyces sp. PmtG]
MDIDQLGIRFPEPLTDPGHHRMKLRNPRAVVASFRDAGTSCVVVPGVVDAGRGVPPADVPRARPTVCRLRADHGTLRRRFLGHDGHHGALDAMSTSTSSASTAPRRPTTSRGTG